jgi:glycosyltransferase involved in cell wall biosynthesis
VNSPAPLPPLRLVYSVADQDFARTKSLGILNLSLGLLHALARRPSDDIGSLHILANAGLRDRVPSPTDRISVSTHDSACGGRLGRILWDQWGVLRAAARRPADWLILPKGFAPFLRPRRLPVAAYVHDVIGEFYRERYPDAVSGAEARYFRHSLKATLRHAALILTNSEFTRAELLRHAARWGMRIPPARVVPIGIGFEPPVAPGPKTDRVVVLSGRFPHKRTDLAVQYLDRWQRERAYPGEVHWIGGAPPHLDWPAHARWIRHPRLDDPTYQALLRGARVLVYFSEYEGFGMPPVEALLQGTHPVFSRVPASLEVMGDAGFGFENDDVAGFENALDRALAAPADAAALQAARLHVRYAWPAVAERALAALRPGPSR